MIIMKLQAEARNKEVKRLKLAVKVFQQSVDETKVTMEAINQQFIIINKVLNGIKGRL